ncbi:MAG: aldehyde ferredoxin oxidoreductase family protein [Desulfobacteraceae bacterium]
MKQITGTTNRVLSVNLSDETFETVEISRSDRENYLGGKGLALKLLYDRFRPGADPLGGENIFIVMTGVLTGTGVACSSRFSAVTKSPLTGITAHSSCGGPFGAALKGSGWDGIIIDGKAKKPLYLVIDYKGVTFKSASGIWGKETGESQRLLAKEGSGSLVIGPAGENLVSFANICSGHRFFGRGGMGAVLGAKNLKGMVALGKEVKIIPANTKKLKKADKKLKRYINSNRITSGSYRKFGTNANVNLCNAAGILPVRNFTLGSHDEAGCVSGEKIAESYRTKFSTCKHCTILCGHKFTAHGKEMKVPEYETTGLLGTNLEIFDPVVIAQWNEICSEMGMDTISAGGTLAWAMEAEEKKLFKTGLTFGSPKGVGTMLRNIALKKGPGRELAAGTRALSEKYGGKAFAIHVKGMELAAYDPRGVAGHGLSYATANRGGCHLSTSLCVLEGFLGLADPYSEKGKPYMVKFFENCFSAVNSLHICQFTSFAVFLEPFIVKMSPLPVLKFFMNHLTPAALGMMDISLWPNLWSAVTGIAMNSSKFKKAGERIHVLERYINTRQGITREDDKLPPRFLNEGRKNDPAGATLNIDHMLEAYYKSRGFDSRGIPTDATLKRLGIK